MFQFPLQIGSYGGTANGNSQWLLGKDEGGRFTENIDSPGAS